MKKYVCDVCGYIYDPEKGDPDSGIAPGTPFEARQLVLPALRHRQGQFLCHGINIGHETMRHGT